MTPLYAHVRVEDIRSMGELMGTGHKKGPREKKEKELPETGTSLA